MKKESPGQDSAGKFIKGNRLSKITKEDLERLVDEYCLHRSKGLDKHSFKGCDYRTLERNATDLQTEKIRMAEADGWLLWETAGMNIALGISDTLPGGKKITPSKCNTTMAIFMMKNKLAAQYGERQDPAAKKPGDSDKPDIPLSTPFKIIDPISNEIIQLNIGESND